MRDLARGFRLGEWVVKPDDGSLTSPETALRLEPLLMDLLLLLSSRAAEVVPKREVIHRVWGGRYVSDETVKASFYQLRKALGDDSRKPRFIETLPKRGYRMLVRPAPLERLSEPEALCRKGRDALAGEPSAAALKQALVYFEQSLAAGPDYPEALAGIARTCILMAASGAGRAKDLWPRARESAEHAVKLAPDLAEAHLCLAVIYFAAGRDFPAAAREFELAIQLDPRDPLARRWHARALSSQARHAEAIEEARRAVELDPLSVAARRDLLEVLFLARRYEEVLPEAARCFEIEPAAPDIRLGLVWLHCLRGEPRQAFDAFMTALDALGVSAELAGQAREAFASGGIQAILRLWAAWLERQDAAGFRARNDLIALYALMGETARGFALIEASIEEGNPFLLWLPVSPLFDNLRGDPRYRTALARLSQPFPHSPHCRVAVGDVAILERHTSPARPASSHTGLPPRARLDAAFRSLRRRRAFGAVDRAVSNRENDAQRGPFRVPVADHARRGRDGIHRCASYRRSRIPRLLPILAGTRVPGHGRDPHLDDFFHHRAPDSWPILAQAAGVFSVRRVNGIDRVPDAFHSPGHPRARHRGFHVLHARLAQRRSASPWSRRLVLDPFGSIRALRRTRDRGVVPGSRYCSGLLADFGHRTP